MKLSVVTVCYNAEKCIEKTIVSVLNQKTPVYEYIIVDGGSTDKTVSIVERYAKQFEEKGIRYIYKSEKDKGISDAFNKGINQATGDLIGLINADDELLPDTSRILEAHWKDGVEIYYGNCIWVDTERKVEYVSKPSSNDLNKLLYRMILIHPSTFVTKSAYERVGNFDITYRYCMDKELLYRMYRAGIKFEYIDECLTKFKAGGVSDKNATAVFKEGSRMALGYGEPKIKVLLVEYRKRARQSIVSIVKRTPIFNIVKRAKKSGTDE